MAWLSTERALQIWQDKGLLGADQVATLRRALADDMADSGTRRGIVIFSYIGAVLVGVGIILFIGSNWERVGPLSRFALVSLAYGSVCVGAWLAALRALPRVAESLWFLASVALGGGIFLLAQIFNFSLTYWQGPFLWLLGVLAMARARQRAAYGVIAVPLAVLTLGWVGGGSGWFMDDQMEFLGSQRGLSALAPLIGVGFASLGVLVRRSRDWSFMANGLITWGALIVALSLVVSTAVAEAPRHIFDLAFTLKQNTIIVAVLVLVAAACGVGVANRDARTMLAVVAVLGLALIVPNGHGSLIGEVVDENLAMFAAYVVAVFALSIASVWVGVRSFNRHLVNLGVASSSIIIMIQYFAWSFEMLPTSFAFILGGIALMAVSIVMERTRRSMIARLEARERE